MGSMLVEPMDIPMYDYNTEGDFSMQTDWQQTSDPVAMDEDTHVEHHGGVEVEMEDGSEEETYQFQEYEMVDATADESQPSSSFYSPALVTADVDFMQAATPEAGALASEPQFPASNLDTVALDDGVAANEEVLAFASEPENRSIDADASAPEGLAALNDTQAGPSDASASADLPVIDDEVTTRELYQEERPIIHSVAPEDTPPTVVPQHADSGDDHMPSLPDVTHGHEALTDPHVEHQDFQAGTEAPVVIASHAASSDVDPDSSAAHAPEVASVPVDSSGNIFLPEVPQSDDTKPMPSGVVSGAELAAESDQHQVSDGLELEPVPGCLLTVSSPDLEYAFDGYLFNTTDTASSTDSKPILLHDFSSYYYEPLHKVFTQLHEDERVKPLVDFYDAKLSLRANDLHLYISENYAASELNTTIIPDFASRLALLRAECERPALDHEDQQEDQTYYEDESLGRDTTTRYDAEAPEQGPEDETPIAQETGSNDQSKAEEHISSKESTTDDISSASHVAEQNAASEVEGHETRGTSHQSAPYSPQAHIADTEEDAAANRLSSDALNSDARVGDVFSNVEGTHAGHDNIVNDPPESTAAHHTQPDDVDAVTDDEEYDENTEYEGYEVQDAEEDSLSEDHVNDYLQVSRDDVSVSKDEAGESLNIGGDEVPETEHLDEDYQTQDDAHVDGVEITDTVTDHEEHEHTDEYEDVSDDIGTNQTLGPSSVVLDADDEVDNPEDWNNEVDEDGDETWEAGSHNSSEDVHTVPTTPGTPTKPNGKRAFDEVNEVSEEIVLESPYSKRVRVE
ncbi:hypothetical protein FISHEDRAFT_78523 [Fistulina hepatica ATCC 64428]|nr:hypothetical protein FISHEDRAFT_78523 [Fistulina hepatica ATCC 64428]